jgi:hypothetical protein
MKSTKQDTFSTGHARRMRECRKRKRQQDPVEYTNRVNTQQRQYRLRTQKLESILQMRKVNRLRQRCFRLNQSNDEKRVRKEKDRNSKHLKRKQQQQLQLNKSINNDESSISVSSNILHTIMNLQNI